MDHREQQFERAASIAAEHCDAVLLVVTWVDEHGETQTYETSRGNAHAVEGMIYSLTQQQDEDAEADESFG